MRLFAICMVVAMAMNCLTAEVSAQEPKAGERLRLEIPDTFWMAHNQSSAKATIREFIPEGETVENWSTMLTSLIMYDTPDISPKTFAQNYAAFISASCEGSVFKEIEAGVENGYDYAVWLMYCPSVPVIGKPEFNVSKVFISKNTVYLTQYARRQSPDEEDVAIGIGFLQTVSLCDTRDEKRPCPE
ncbi:MAG: hypothetical protein QM645_11775 [Asticcacaulis sp.]